MKVAVVFYELPPEGGGGFTFQETLLRTLQARGAASRHEFVFYAAGAGGFSGVREIPRSYASIRGRALLRGMREVQDAINVPRMKRARTWLEKELEQQGVDIVWFASHHLEECDLPFISTVWDLEHARQPWFPELSKDGEWERRHHYWGGFLPKATRILVSNEALEELVSTTYGLLPDRFLKIPFPTPDFALDAKPDPDADRAAVERLGVNRPYLFYPAQFWAHKNHVTLIDALAQLDGYELVLTGSDKGQLDHVRSLARAAGVEQRVKFLGFVSTEDLVALYREAHALTYMSWFGPENLPPLEALALGCPVVCADVPGMQIQLGDSALFVGPTDAAAVADCVRRLEDDGLRAELTERGERLARSRTADGYVDGVVAFLDDFEPVRKSWQPARPPTSPAL